MLLNPRPKQTENISYYSAKKPPLISNLGYKLTTHEVAYQETNGGKIIRDY
jgi:hypothetical protein